MQGIIRSLYGNDIGRVGAPLLKKTIQLCILHGESSAYLVTIVFRLLHLAHQRLGADEIFTDRTMQERTTSRVITRESLLVHRVKRVIGTLECRETPTYIQHR